MGPDSVARTTVRTLSVAITEISVWPVVSTKPTIELFGVAWFELVNRPACQWRGRRIEIAPGLLTDYASVPALARSLLSPIGSHSGAAVFHDAGYQRRLIVDGRRVRWGRWKVDSLFLDLMAASGVGTATRLAVWAVVRLGGREAWRHWAENGRS